MWHILALAAAGAYGTYKLVKAYKESKEEEAQTKKETRKRLSRMAVGGLIAITMAADGHPSKGKLEIAKKFIREHFSEGNQLEILRHIQHVLEQNRPNTDFYLNTLNLSYDYKKRFLLTDLLYQIACQGGGICTKEWNLLLNVMNKLHITRADKQRICTYYHSYLTTNNTNYYTDGSYEAEQEGNGYEWHEERPHTRRRALAIHYATLGLDSTATAAEVKQKYRELAKIYHPDRLVGLKDEKAIEAYTRRFKLITEAYNAIMAAK